jgi:4'-phosphopantetheinyl transferase
MRLIAPPAWLTRSRADLPRGYGWLGERERAVLAGLRFERRRDDWLLGRWTAKCAVAAHAGVAPNRVEVLAAPDGVPEAWVDGERAALSLSLSHRAGRALTAIADPRQRIGCDLELVEPRSGAFVREWLAPAERELVRVGADPPLTANLVWTAKEAAAKVQREGLRLDVRNAAATIGDGGGEWKPLTIAWPDGAPTCGWWRAEPGWVMTVAAAPAPEAPVPL